MKKRPITFFVFLSLLIHLLFLIFFWKNLDLFNKRQSPPHPVWVELKKIELPQRIADIPQPVQEEVPDQPSAQALYNQKVKEEMVQPSPVANRQSTESEPPTPPKKKKLDDLKPTFDELYGMKPPQQSTPDLLTHDDYFPDYKVGGRTYLNTSANPNIAYFVELKRRFKNTFNPVPSIRRNLNEISRGKIEVVLGVSVNSRGELANLVVIRSSGLDDYDREGVRTVRSSSPFSTPPSHLLQPDGLVHMAWTFVVYL